MNSYIISRTVSLKGNKSINNIQNLKENLESNSDVNCKSSLVVLIVEFPSHNLEMESRGLWKSQKWE